MASRVLLEAQHHRFKHFERLFFIGHERVLLGVATQADAFLQVVHGKQMVLPQAVEDREHDDALVVAHLRRRKNLLLDVIAATQLFKDGFAQVVA